jgi:hypothetical protein
MQVNAAQCKWLQANAGVCMWLQVNAGQRGWVRVTPLAGDSRCRSGQDWARGAAAARPWVSCDCPYMAMHSHGTAAWHSQAAGGCSCGCLSRPGCLETAALRAQQRGTAQQQEAPAGQCVEQAVPPIWSQCSHTVLGTGARMQPGGIICCPEGPEGAYALPIERAGDQADPSLAWSRIRPDHCPGQLVGMLPGGRP